MIMAKNIVTRLRDETQLYPSNSMIHMLLAEAADEIVRLRAGTVRNSHK
jgi:hypothetical protein